MGVRSLIALVSLVSLVSFAGCSKSPQRLEPATQGKRGENCQARNDCEAGLACLNGVCGKNEFDIKVEVKQCDRIECAETSDCCGDKPTEAPTKCNERDKVCPATLANCSTSMVCTDDDDVCGAGICRPATCSNGAVPSCEVATDCQDVCTAGACSLTLGACVVNADCPSFAATATATCLTANRRCNCVNPDYVAGAAICSDPDCTDVCLLRCQNERCVTDRSCDDNADCSAFGLPLCDQDRCVECKKDSDCDKTADETCEDGQCHKPCQRNEECALFEECNTKTGDCTYVGCKSDRECILAANRAAETPTGAATPLGEDPRLLKCLASGGDSSIKTCKIPCENDGSCGAQSVCDKGFCKFIGCETDEECRAYLGIANQMSTEARPFVPTAVCRE